jgi:GNAT superfamily N-acetyltransferase
MDIRVRKATAQDVPLLKELVDEMAVFERLASSITEDALLRDGFQGKPKYRALLAFSGEKPAGYAFVYDCYSSFDGRGLYLEDIYVRSAYRGKTAAIALLRAVARAAAEDDCFGIVLNVLRWNAPSYKFFARAGATILDDRQVLRISRERLEALAHACD